MKFQVPTSMRRHCLWLCSVTVALFAVSTLQAQKPVEQRHVIFTASKRAHGSGILSANRSVALDVDMNRFRSVAGAELRIAGMPLATGVTADLDLREYTIIAPNAQLSFTDDNGVHPLPPLTARLYRGKVTGDASSDVYLAFSPSGVMGMVTTAGKGYEIASDFTAPAASGTIAAVSAPSAELTGNTVNCGVDDNAKGPIDLMSKEELARLMDAQIAAAGSIDFSVIGAFDADYEYVQLFSGNKQAAADYMLSTIGQVSAVYERDLSTQLVIGYMNLWDTQSDPYTQSGVIQLALEEARDWWMNNRDTVTRGFTNVFSGKPWTGAIGVAYLGGLCYKVPAIGFCGITRTNPTRDTRVVAHETGHIFGSKHTHDCSWPGGAIDQCAAAEGGSCFTQIKQTQGTIMSYCNQSDFKFHEKCATFLKGNLQSGVNLPCIILSRALSVENYLVVFPVVDVGTKVDTTIQGFYYNQSKEAVTVTKQELTGNNIDKFTITSDAPPFTLGPGESKDLSISYESDEDVASQAVLTITHTGQNPAAKVTLEAYSLTNKPNMAFFADTKGEVNWGLRKVGRQGDTLVPNLYGNIGRGPLHVTKTEIVGPDRFEFELLEGSAPFDIEKQERHSAKLRFAPTSVGTKVAYLRVEHNASTKVDSVKLTGNVEQGPLLQVKANDLVVDFHDRVQGQQYDSTFSQFFSNIGSDTMTLSFYIAGPDRDLFNTNTSGLQELVPGGTIDFHVGLFAADDEPDGQKQAQLVINPVFQDQVYDTLVINLLARLGPPASVEWTSQKNSGISVVPNPTAGDADIQIAPMPDELGSRYTLRLTDALGKELDLRNGTFTSDGITYRLKGKNIASGVYYISVTTERGTRVAPVTLAR